MLKRLGIFCFTAIIVGIIAIIFNLILTNSVKVDFNKLEKEILKEYNVQMCRRDNVGIKDDLGISTDEVVDSLVLTPLVSDKVERCIILKVKSGNEKAYISALETYASQYKQDVDEYMTDQVKYIDEKTIGSKYNYVYLVIGSNKDKVIDIINNNIKR